MGFSRQEYWGGLPCPPPGDLPDPGIKPESLMSPALAGGFFTTSATWETWPPPWAWLLQVQVLLQNLGNPLTHELTGLLWKSITQEQPDWRDAQGKVCGKGCELPCSLWGHSSHTARCSPAWMLFEPCSFFFFLEDPLYRHDWLNQWSLVTDSTSSPSFLLGNQRVGPKVPTL